MVHTQCGSPCRCSDRLDSRCHDTKLGSSTHRCTSYPRDTRDGSLLLVLWDWFVVMKNNRKNYTNRYTTHIHFHSYRICPIHWAVFDLQGEFCFLNLMYTTLHLLLCCFRYIYSLCFFCHLLPHTPTPLRLAGDIFCLLIDLTFYKILVLRTK